jgi:hypothetical protein
LWGELHVADYGIVDEMSIVSNYFRYTLVFVYSHANNWKQLCKKSERYRNPWTGPEGSRKLRLPDFKPVGI